MYKAKDLREEPMGTSSVMKNFDNVDRYSERVEVVLDNRAVMAAAVPLKLSPPPLRAE